MANKIICPKCNEEIDIENLIKAGAKKEMDKELELQKERFEKEIELAVGEVIENKNKEFKLKEEKLKQKILEENKEMFEQMEHELKEKSEQIKQMNKLKAENSRIEREKQELEDKIKAEKEREFTLKLLEEKQKVQKASDEKYELQIKELQKQLQDQKDLTLEMQKRQEQGSMQLQGEVQELLIEEYLKQNFKYDEIKEIAKGDYGADSIQAVRTMQGVLCGTIYYESKRTKTFKQDWISKFKKDIQEKGADIGVLVTAVYPKTMDKMGLYEGIYICSFEEFKALSHILRENILRLSEVKELQNNRHEKSAILYNFLTSTEFKLQIETIVNAFVTMQNDLEAEKRAMNKIWKKREKEIENVISATTDMYGSIQGIAGNAVQKVDALEMPLLSIINEN